MKKKLEGELISIAHRVLKLKNRSETVLLQREAKKLYEQLTVLRFYEENFEALKEEISPEQIEEKLEQMSIVAALETTDLEEKVAEVAQSVDEAESVEPHKEEIVEEKEEISVETIIPTEIVEEQIVAEEIVEEVIKEEATEEPIVSEPQKEIQATAEDINRIVAEMTSKKEEKKQNEPQQISFEDLLGSSYKEPEFVRVEDTPKEVEQAADLVFEKKEEVEITKEEIVEAKNDEFSYKPQNTEKHEPKTMSLNDRLNNGISFGLNDRIAFEKKLFGGSPDDFNRVISQLNTFDSFEEAKGFIESFVKPDYNDWSGKEEYETRFLEIVEKKFN